MEPVTLKRTGQPPLCFTGRRLAYACDDQAALLPGESEHSRWHELSMYETQAGSWVAHAAFRSSWLNELPHDFVAAGTLPEACAALAAYDPTPRVRGYPPSERYRDLQRRLLEDVRRRYLWALSKLLEQLPQSTERIE